MSILAADVMTIIVRLSGIVTTLSEPTGDALDAAAPALRSSAVMIINLLWFRSEITYAEDITNPQADARSAVHPGYAVAFL